MCFKQIFFACDTLARERKKEGEREECYRFVNSLNTENNQTFSFLSSQTFIT